MADAIVLESVTKRFGSKVAVRGFDLAVPEGKLYGFIGPNGAGKTTTIRMIMSILFPDEGRLRVLGRASAVESKDRIGYLPEERGIYRKMKVGAFLHYMGRLKGVDGPELRRRVGAWLERVGLADVAKKKCEELSKGMQQKVQFISAVLHEPDLIILDEPFSGLDPVNSRLLRDLIAEQRAAGRTLIFSTHVMHQAETLCDHIVMIHDGQKVLDSTLPEIRQRYDPRSIVVEPLDPERAAGPIASVPGVRAVEALNGRLEAHLHPGVDPQAAMQSMMAAAPVASIELRRPTLEDVFIEIVSGQGVADEAALRASLHAAEDAMGGDA